MVRVNLCASAIAIHMLFASIGAVADVPRVMTFQGRLTGNGEGPVNLEMRFYDAAAGGNLLFSEAHPGVPRPDGLFTLQLGSQTAGGLPQDALDYTRLNAAAEGAWIEIAAEGSTLAPRTRLGMAPYAGKAAVAERLVKPGTFASAVEVAADGSVGIGTAVPAFPVDAVTANADDAFNVGLRISRQDVGTTPLRLGNYFKSADWRSGGMIAAEGSLNLAYNQGGGSATFNVFNNPNDDDIDSAVPVLSCGVDGSTTVRVLHILGGSDLAEPGQVTAAPEHAGAVQPGKVVSINPTEPGKLMLSTEAYDRKVAGVISGAGGVHPGMIMRQEGHPVAAGEHPIAMAGRVYVWCDASTAPITPGDLLTTSNVAGHAMRADHTRVFPRGCVIGKAMSGLTEGRGLVLMLVQPQ